MGEGGQVKEDRLRMTGQGEKLKVLVKKMVSSSSNSGSGVGS